MRQRPVILWMVAGGFLLVAASLPAQIMVLYGHGLDELDAVFGKLTVLNWLVLGGALTCAWSVVQALPWSARGVQILTLIVAFNNFFVGAWGLDYSLWQAGLASVLFAGFNLPFYRGSLRQLLVQPELRWWRHATRHRRRVPVAISIGRRALVRTETFDLSESGAFLALRADTGLKVDDRILLRLNFGSFAQVRCEGRIVRQAAARGGYPDGFGVQFTNLDVNQLRELRRHLQQI